LGAPPTPDADDYFEDFESYMTHVSLASPEDWVPLEGQTAPSGKVWKNAFIWRAYSGIVNNAIALTGPNWNPSGKGDLAQGVVGGPDPLGVHGQFLANPRGTIEPQSFLTSRESVAQIRHQFYAPTASEPLVITVDVYLDNLKTRLEWQPFSRIEFGSVTTVSIGGEFNCNSDSPCNGTVGDFVSVVALYTLNLPVAYSAQGLRIQPNEWTTIAIRMTLEGMSVWVQNRETLGDNASGQPFDAPGFSGEIFDTGWAQVLPGIEDDDQTTAIEGPGLATAFCYCGSPGSSPLTVIDSAGHIVARYPRARSVDEFKIWTGNDVLPAPHDFYVDNYRALGQPGCEPDPRFTLPQVIDNVDLATLIIDWGTAAYRSDFDYNGMIDGADLAILLARWGPCGH